jgi:hypothetical protein
MITQLKLPLRLLVRTPMLTLAGARGALGIGEDDIRDMIESAELPWAWDISTKGAGRTELRILAACVEHAQKDLLSRTSPVGPPEINEADVIRLLYGEERPWLWGKEFHRAWNFDRRHLFNLIFDGSLQLLPRTRWRRGPGGSPCVTWNSAVEFLRARKL